MLQSLSKLTLGEGMAMTLEYEHDVEKLRQRIERARERGRATMRGRAMMAGIIAGVPGIVELEVVFPEPDMMHVFNCILGRRVGEPTIYRLSFGRPMKWVGISRSWGLKPGDIDLE